jgi:DNA invertase Pin-like site-specific DNA recombinase
MLKSKFVRSEQRDVVVYLRMSSENQSRSSPDQQLRSIEKRVKDADLPWKIVKIYRDDAKSGKTVRHRDGFSEMLREIKTGAVSVTAILVDTIERFGRMDDLDKYRRDLRHRHGVYVLTADRNFADPNSVEAKYTEVFENLRASEDSRLKANDVVRGKIQAVMDGYWPGSPVPIGFNLEVAHTEKRRNRDVKHHKLVHDPVTASIMRILFEASAERPSWGQTRLARYMNAHTQVPDQYKPFHAATVGYQLKNPIYRGILVWSKHSTGLVDERRVLERNEEQDVVRVPNFCEPICDAETIRKVDAGIAMRSRKRRNEAAAIRGINYRYVLTGLVRCGHCGGSMVPCSTSPYTTKGGDTKVYCSYTCPNRRNGICENDKPVKEEWLREIVVKKLVERLLSDEETKLSLIAEVRAMVEEQRVKDHAQHDRSLPRFQSELAELQKKVSGWAITLSQPQVSSILRDNLIADSNAALERIEEIKVILESRASESVVFERLVQESEIEASLNRLSEALTGECPTLANLELSTHIDHIECFQDGRVVCRSCKIGSVPDAVIWFSQSHEDSKPSADTNAAGNYRTKPRRRAWMNVDDSSCTDEKLRDRMNMATDPHRFDRLPDNWFWVDEFQIPEPTCWTKENAVAVLERFNKLNDSGQKFTLNTLAREFSVSRPTISRALDIALSNDNAGPTPHRKEPTVKVKGNPEIENRIAELHDDRLLNKDIGTTLNISRSTVTNALDRLYQKRGLPRPDGRGTRHR